jgi:hypothetical protein
MSWEEPASAPPGTTTVSRRHTQHTEISPQAQRAAATEEEAHALIALPPVCCAGAVWKSSFTFNNLTAVSAMCRATYAFAPLVPSCGAGLKCFPQDSSTYLQFSVFPSCPACPLPITLRG